MFLSIIYILVIGVLMILKTRLSPKYKLVEKHFSGPIDFPLFGTALIGLGNNNKLFKMISNFVVDYPDRCRQYMGPILYLFVYNPEDAEAILGNSKHITKWQIYEYLRPWLGDGLLISTGDKWRSHKKLFNPFFNNKVLEKFIPVFNKNNNILIRQLDKYADQDRVFDVYKYMLVYAIDNIYETALGTEINAMLDPESEYVTSTHIAAESVVNRITKFWYRSDLIFKMSQLGRKSCKALDIIHKQAERDIQARRKHYQTLALNNNTKLDWKELNIKGKVAFIDILLQSADNGELTEKDILDEVETILIGGYDTTSSILSFILYELARNPNVQRIAYEELKGIFGNEDRDATVDDLKGMIYLEKVIKETMRLYPAIVVYGRKYSKEMLLPDGRLIPKDTEVGVISMCLHMNPKVWPNPEEFNPERFNADAVAARHPYAYVAFSSGTRSCVGQKFAMLEMKAVISHVLRRFEILPPTNPKDEMVIGIGIVIKSMNGVNIRINRRS